MEKTNKLMQKIAFNLKAEQQKLAQINTTIKNFKNFTLQLQKQVYIEEQKVQIFDITSPLYSPAAKACYLRVEKLESSIKDLIEQKNISEQNITKLNDEFLHLDKVKSHKAKNLKLKKAKA